MARHIVTTSLLEEEAHALEILGDELGTTRAGIARAALRYVLQDGDRDFRYWLEGVSLESVA